ncbi:MAG: FAD:protein FMN transferase [Pseudomonadota bacterium]
MPSAFTLSRRSVLLMPACLAACNWKTSVVELSGTTMGTTYSLAAVDHSNVLSRSELQDAVDGALFAVNRALSNWDRDSEISRLNAARTSSPIAISPDLRHTLAAAEEIHHASEGQFDVTVGPLVELWGFGAGRAAPNRPATDAIADAKAAGGQSQALRLGANTVEKLKPEAEIYLAGIGKGFGVDKVAEALKAHGLKDFMVEIGGDIVTAGRNPDGLPWQLGIERPQMGRAGVLEVVEVSGKGLATSGDYRNFFVEGGQRYSHIIDPTTGRPITHQTVSATVVADNAMLADGWATAMLALGRERGLAVAEANKIAVLFVEREGDGPDAALTLSRSRHLSQLQA